MTLRIEFKFGLEKHLVTFLGELLGKTRLNQEYNIDYPDICTGNPVVTIDGLHNSEDLEQVMMALRKIEDLRDDEEERGGRMLREAVSNILHEKFRSYIAYKSKKQLIIECTSTGYIFEIIRCRYDKESKRFVHIECTDERVGLGAVVANNLILENALENSQDGLLEIMRNLKDKTQITEQSNGDTIIREEYDDIDKDDWELM